MEEQFNIPLNTRFITLDDFKLYSGIDLEAEMKSDGNPSRTAEAFLLRTITRLESYLTARYFRSPEREYKDMTDYQKYHYKLALIEQCMYIYKVGDVTMDSGYDADFGKRTDINYLKQISIAPNAENELMNCGMLSRKMRYGTYGGDGGNGWMY